MRIAGPDRYGTAAAISTTFFTGPVAMLYIANGTNFPDALVGAAAAGHVGAPILLVAPTSIPDATAAAITALAPKAIKVLGGTASVSDAVKNALGAAAKRHPDAPVGRRPLRHRGGHLPGHLQDAPGGHAVRRVRLELPRRPRGRGTRPSRSSSPRAERSRRACWPRSRASIPAASSSSADPRRSAGRWSRRSGRPHQARPDLSTPRSPPDPTRPTLRSRYQDLRRVGRTIARAYGASRHHSQEVGMANLLTHRHLRAVMCLVAGIALMAPGAAPRRRHAGRRADARLRGLGRPGAAGRPRPGRGRIRPRSLADFAPRRPGHGAGRADGHRALGRVPRCHGPRGRPPSLRPWRAGHRGAPRRRSRAARRGHDRRAARRRRRCRVERGDRHHLRLRDRACGARSWASCPTGRWGGATCGWTTRRSRPSPTSPSGPARTATSRPVIPTAPPASAGPAGRAAP